MIGEISGCLEIVGKYEDLKEKLYNIEREIAYPKWNRQDWITKDWSDEYFAEWYHLNLTEKELLIKKAEMPESFLSKSSKYDSSFLHSFPFLYHKKKPNTYENLKKAYKEKRLIKVKCSKCGREYITDLDSFNCTKWRTCIGAECLKTTIVNNKNHDNSLYDWNNKKYELKTIDTTLMTVAEMGNQLSYYSIPVNPYDKQLKIAYISDIHILHHVNEKTEKCIEETIDNIANELCESISNPDVIVFNGDIASKSEIVIRFFDKFTTLLKHKTSRKYNMYFVLGNHEFIGFPNIELGVKYYKSNLTRYGVKVLHNESIRLTYKWFDEQFSFLIFGGTGFAKYNELYNADNLVACENFTRKDEIKETEAFEKEYFCALQEAKENKMCFICISHYPIESCHNDHFDKEAIYFTGHDHHNRYVKNESKVLYADNQIGYKQKHFGFKYALTGVEINPYAYLEDGLFVTSIEDYLQFYRYIGENVGDGTTLYRKCENGRANLYVIKHNGYYGFFVMCPQGTSKGIFIVNGGKLSKITSTTDMSWICENFDIVLTKYLKVLLPLRTLQEKISSELKKLGFDGTIHGTIVDIDFYHHIMINTIEETISMYYSPTFGCVQYFSNFTQVLDSVNKNSFEKIDIEKIKNLVSQKDNNGEYALTCITSNTKLSENIYISSDESFTWVSRSEGAYGVSRKVNPLQRLFSGRVLRNFDVNLTETRQETYRESKYLNRFVIYEGKKYIVSEDDGSDIVVLQQVHTNELGCLTIASEEKRISVTQLKKCFTNQKGWLDVVTKDSGKITVSEVKEAVGYWNDDKILTFPFLKKNKSFGFIYDDISASNELIKEFLYVIPKEYYDKGENTVEIINRIGLNNVDLFPDYAWNLQVIMGLLNCRKVKDIVEILPLLPEVFASEEVYIEIRKNMTQKNRPNWCPKYIWNAI